MRPLWNLVKRKWAWACQNKLFWANALLAMLTLAIVCNPGPSDFRIRVWSLVLQLIGAFTVWHDLIGAAADFGASGIIRRNWVWLKRGFGVRTYTNVSADFPISYSIAGAVGQARVALDPNASIEQRLQRLEAYIELVNDAATQAVVLIHEKDRELNEKIRQTRTELERSVTSINERLKDAMVGNYPVLLFGAAWVAIGTCLSTFAPEIPKLWAGDWGFCPLPFDNVDFLKFKHFGKI